MAALFGSGGIQFSWVCLVPHKDQELKTQVVTAENKGSLSYCPAAAPALACVTGIR